MDEDTRSLVSGLLALLTAKAEDAAAVAAEGQNKTMSTDQLRDYANQLQTIGEEINSVAAALRTMLSNKRLG